MAPLKLLHARAVAAATLAALLAVPSPSMAAPATRRGPRPTPSPTPDPRPDRALFAEAQQALETLKASSAQQSRKAEWDKDRLASSA